MSVSLSHLHILNFLSLSLLQDIQIDALLIRACEPVTQAHCHVSARTFLCVHTNICGGCTK